MENCFIYLRVSTDEQAQQGFSIDNQKRACVDYARLKDYHVKKIFTDDGESARTTDRPALQEMLEMLNKKADVQSVIIYKIDRFARCVRDFATLFEDFKAKGVKLISVSEGDLTEGSSSLVANIFASVAQWESEVNGQRTRDALMQKFREGYQPTPPPIGYRSVGGEKERKTCEPDPVVAPIIKQLFELYATGNYSIVEIQNWLEGQNLVSKTGTPLGHSVINGILSNSFYYGQIRWHGEAKMGKHAPVISKNLFDTCQFVLAKHRDFLIRKRIHNFLLRGFIFCSECGQRFTAEWHKDSRKLAKRGGKIAYYHCQKRGHNGCPGLYVEMETLEKLVLETISQIKFSQEFIDAVVGKTKAYVENARKISRSEIQALQNRKTALEGKRNKLEDALLDGTIDRTVFKRKHEELQTAIDAIEEQFCDIENRKRIDINLIEEVLAMTRNIVETYRTAPPFLKRHYLRFFYEKIFVKNRTIDHVVYTPIISSLQDNKGVIISPLQLPREDSNLQPST